MTKNKWFALVKMLAPIILTTVRPELAPIADKITDGIEEAEKLKEAGTIKDKLKHVQLIASNAADSINIAKGKEVIDKEHLDAAVNEGVSTVIHAINIVNKK
jgi:hypothetical protein